MNAEKFARATAFYDEFRRLDREASAASDAHLASELRAKARAAEQEGARLWFEARKP